MKEVYSTLEIVGNICISPIHLFLRALEIIEQSGISFPFILFLHVFKTADSTLVGSCTSQTPVCWRIQSLNCATRANTEYWSLASQLSEPQLTAPWRNHLPLDDWQTYGPPLSPKHPLWGFPSIPAQIIVSVILTWPPPMQSRTNCGTVTKILYVFFKIKYNVYDQKTINL